MGLFDGQGMGNAPETLGDMYRGVGRSVGTGMIDPYMEGKGFTSKENQVLAAMKGVDLTSPESVSDTFNKIMAIDTGLGVACADLQATGGVSKIILRSWLTADVVTYGATGAHTITNIQSGGDAAWFVYEFKNV